MLCLWDLLPELLGQIFHYCSLDDVKNLSCCNTILNETVKEFIWVCVTIPGKSLAAKDFPEVQKRKLANLKYTKILRIGDSYLYRRKQIANYQTVLENCSIHNVHTFMREGKLFIDAECIVNTFQKLTNLKRVAITDVEISPKSFECLGLLKSVSVLNLSSTLVENTVLEGICNHLSSLEELNLRRTKVTDKGFYGLQKLKCLRSLIVKDCRIHDIGISYIGWCTGLKKLDISTCYISDKGLASLTELKELTRLDLSHMHSRIINDHGVMLGNNLTDIGIAYLSNLTSLRDLLVNCEGITHRSIEKLCTLRFLTNLEIRTSEVNDECMKLLSRLPHLTHLDISGCFGITDDGFAYLTALKGLKSLKCEANYLGDTHSDNISDNALAHIATVSTLRCLVVSSYHITDSGIAELKKLNHLRQLNIWSPDLTDEGFKSIGEITSLRQLDISSFKNITDTGFEHLSRLPNLRSLTCVHTNLTDDGMVHLAKMTALEFLDVSESKITDECLCYVQQLKSLQTFICVSTGMTEVGLAKLQGLKHVMRTQQEVRKIFKVQ